MKKTLKEELERIHQISKINEVDEKKADLVNDDVENFFKTLESISTDLTQQPQGTAEYQKDVEAMQIGLILLGYELPIYGVDGKFGIETAAAVEKFKQDNDLGEENPVIESVFSKELNEHYDLTKRMEELRLNKIF